MIFALLLAALVRTPSIQSMQTSRLIGMAVAAAAACSGCKILEDDDEPPPVTGAIDPTGGDTDADKFSCFHEALAVIESTCEPWMSWWVSYSEGESNAILIDDPGASIGVGPGAWLVRVNSDADYVGTYHHVGEDCGVACGWCEQGFNVCHGGFTEQGLPRCWTCFHKDDPLAGEQCAVVQAACNDDDESLDETGAGTTDGIGEYDCTTWQPEEGVRRSRDGTITVPSVLIDDALLYQGEPLASCDDTRFRRQPDGYFEISRIGEHGLLAAMGLARGDVVMAVNGKPMNTLDAVMQAASGLSDGAIFTLTINRGDGRFEMRVFVR